MFLVPRSRASLQSRHEKKNRSADLDSWPPARVISHKEMKKKKLNWKKSSYNKNSGTWYKEVPRGQENVFVITEGRYKRNPAMWLLKSLWENEQNPRSIGVWLIIYVALKFQNSVKLQLLSGSGLLKNHLPWLVSAWISVDRFEFTVSRVMTYIRYIGVCF